MTHTHIVLGLPLGIEQPVLTLVPDDGPTYIHEIPKQGDKFLSIGGPEDTLATVYGQAKISSMTKVRLLNHAVVDVLLSFS